MKYDNTRAYQKHLSACNAQQYADVYVIISKDTAECDEAVALTLKELLGEGADHDLILKTFDGETTKIDAVLDELNTIPFLSDSKIVLLRRMDKMKKDALKALESYLDKPNPSVKFVASATALAANTRVYKKAEKAGVILSLAEKKPWEKESAYCQWLQENVSAEGKKMEPRAVQTLVKQTGLDKALLRMEMEKLICYVGDRPQITVADVAAICTRVDIDTIFQLSEAVFRLDAAAALLVARHLLDGGAPLIGMIVQLRRQFQTEFQVCSILANGGNPADITAQFRHMYGKILDKHIQLARGYGMQRFKRGLLSIEETELTAKNSSLAPDFLLERLIMNLAR